ncbi:MAG: TolC family protein [Verrucomicrobiota bacterium]
MQPFSFTRPLGRLTLLGVLLAIAPATPANQFTPLETTDSPQVRRLRLDECIVTALRQNRELQIERLTPAITEANLSGSRGYYDPVFSTEAYAQNATDTGGFDPLDYSRDTIYDAESQSVRSGVTGFLPWGMSYDLFGGYAHSDGVRNGLNFESYKLQSGISLRQPLLRDSWIDQGRMTIQVNKKELKITELGVHYVAMDVINRVQLAYYELAYTLEQAQEQRDFLRSREELLTTVKRRIELGTLTTLDEQLAAARVATVAASLAGADNAVRLAENELRTMLGDAWTNSVTARLETSDALLAVPQTFNLQDSWQQGLASRPDLAQLREDVAKAKIDLKYRRNQLFPALDVVASHVRRGSDTEQLLPPSQPSASLSSARNQIENGDAPTDVVGVVFTLPLGLAKERADFRASKQMKAQAELRVKQYEELVMRQISDALHTARSQFERVTLTRRARELSEAALEAENQKLLGGKSTIFLVLEMQSDLATARTAELRAKADYNKARSQMRFAEASLLEHWRVAIELK